uniref:Ig-like domain-containing protein n=1 Tax=Dicentrarchus labrax TaxID=13489 RepID=A0A8P4K573_DICLA
FKNRLTLQSPLWPLSSILAGVGDDIILPCHLQPALDVTAETVEWKRSDLKPIFIHVWRAGQDLIKERNPSYKGRTSLFINELKHGNISLKLSKVQRSDQGTYECDLPLLQKQSSVRLVVGNLLGIERKRGAVILSCDSNSWYPEPEVVWLDGEGNLLSAGPTETVRGPDDLYTVSSRVTLRSTVLFYNYHVFLCFIISDDFFEVESSSSSATVGLAVTLAVCILIILLLVYFVLTRQTTQVSLLLGYTSTRTVRISMLDCEEHTVTWMYEGHKSLGGLGVFPQNVFN